jgi:predicted MPP superfamily phosphohydrolase
LGDGLSFLSALDAARGVFAVTGNSDWPIDKAIRNKEMPTAFGKWRILTNENVDCGEFVLVGLGDPVTCRDDLERAVSGIDAGKPVFLLTHFYAKRFAPKIDSLGIAMVFSAHTHGGQVGFGPLVSRIPYAYRSQYLAGLYSIGTAHLYVTRGVGVNIFPLRFLCRPEIAVFHLKGA